MKSLYEIFEKDIVSLEEFLQNCKGMTANEIQEKRKYVNEVLIPRIEYEAKLRVSVVPTEEVFKLFGDRKAAEPLYKQLKYQSDDIIHTLYEYSYILRKLYSINREFIGLHYELVTSVEGRKKVK